MCCTNYIVRLPFNILILIIYVHNNEMIMRLKHKIISTECDNYEPESSSNEVSPHTSPNLSAKLRIGPLYLYRNPGQDKPKVPSGGSCRSNRRRIKQKRTDLDGLKELMDETGDDAFENNLTLNSM